MADTIILWGTLKSRAFRCAWMLEELGLKYELRPISYRTGEIETVDYKKINPRRKIPALQDGSFCLCESAAINTYLADKYGRGAYVPAACTQQRALYDMWCLFIMTELDAQCLWVYSKHVNRPEVYGTAHDAVASAKSYFKNQIMVVVDELKTTNAFLLGDEFSALDILLTTVLRWAKRIEWLPSENANALATIETYLEKTMSRSAFNKTVLLSEAV